MVTNAELRRLPYQVELPCGRGLFAKKRKDGTCSWLLRKKMPNRKSPLGLKLGIYPDVSIDEALAKAAEYRNLADQGIHPRDYEKEQKEIRSRELHEKLSKEVTLRSVLEQYNRTSQIKEPPNSPRTIQDRTNAITSVFEEYLDKPVRDITIKNLEDKLLQWQGQGIASPAQGKKAMRYLRSILNYAKDRMGIIDKNPVDAIRHATSLSSKKNKPYLLKEEAKDLFETLQTFHNPHAASFYSICDTSEFSDQRLGMFDAIAIELLSGLRQMEVLSLRWDKVYLEDKDWKRESDGEADGPYFEAYKSKTRTFFGVPITTQMKAVFKRRIEKKQSDYVFPSIRPSADGQYTHIKSDRLAFRTLNKILPKPKKAEKYNANLMRHAFADTAFKLTRSMDIVDSMTGHFSRLDQGGLATGTYIAFQSVNNRDYFQDLNDALLGVETPDWLSEEDNKEWTTEERRSQFFVSKTNIGNDL